MPPPASSLEAGHRMPQLMPHAGLTLAAGRAKGHIARHFDASLFAHFTRAYGIDAFI